MGTPLDERFFNGGIENYLLTDEEHRLVLSPDTPVSIDNAVVNLTDPFDVTVLNDNIDATLTFNILLGQSASQSFDVSDYNDGILIFPAVMEGTSIQFEVSHDDITWVPLKTNAGATLSMPVTISSGLMITDGVIRLSTFIRIRSYTGAVAEPQLALRTFRVILNR